MPLRTSFIFASLVLFLANPPAVTLAADIWVSPSGKDTASGTQLSPVATLTRAAELVRASRAAKPAEPVTVRIGAGVYPVLETLTLGEADSGTASAPVIWIGEDRARVQIVGAKAVDTKRLRRVSDSALLARLPRESRGKVLELDLAAENIEHAGPFPDYLRDTADLCVVFFNGRRLPISRWPNGDYGYSTMKRVVSSGNFKPRQPDGGVFEYSGDRPERWRSALNEGGVWLRGFWRVPWVAETLRVGAIDPKANTISFAVSTSNGIGSKYSKLIDGTRV
ncbi:MAG: hypothetical protein H7Y06_05205, partial [Opitutaceae bacterium]|nr:hypothetical protein [Opitutaceae bacterium]